MVGKSGRRPHIVDGSGFVEFRKVDKTYDGQTFVVKDLELCIKAGEFLTMLGPSGSGKTTTLMMLAGFEEPTSGSIHLDGRSIQNVPANHRNLGIVFQNYALFPHMTVWENIAFPLQMRRVDKTEIRSKVKRALEMVELIPFSDRLPAQISGGQQQRVALARALVFEPVMVLMDEPLGALDKQLREQMQLEIKRIHKNLGVTFLYVTHDQSEALTMSDRIAVFDKGKIQQLAVPEELYERPENAFVAQFIGENNRVSGKVREVNTSTCIVEIGNGICIRAVPVRLKYEGCPVVVSVRPERVRINPDPALCDNIFEARVEEHIYLGDQSRIRVTLPGFDEFVIKVSNNEEVRTFTHGARLSVGWITEHCRALRSSL